MKLIGKFKKMLCWMLAITVLTSLSGCGNGNKGNNSSDIWEYIEVDGSDDVGTAASENESNAASGGNGVGSKNSGSGGNKDSSVKNTVTDIKGSTVKVLVWYEPSESETKSAKAFTSKTGCKVQFIKTSLNNYQTKLASLVSSGAAPDAAAIMLSSYPSMIINGLFEELPTKNFDLKNKLWDIDTMDCYKWNNKYYGVLAKGSTMSDFYMIFFNKTLFEENGVETPYEIWKKNPNDWNWSKLASIAKEMTTGSGDSKIYGLECGYAGVFMWSTGKDFVSVSGNTIKNTSYDEKVRESWKFFNNLRDIDKCLNPANSVEEDFINRKCAMYVNGSWQMQSGGSYGKNMKDDWGAVPFPKQNNGSYYSPFRVTLWGIGKGSKNPAGSAEFLTYWLDSAHYSDTLYAKPEFKEIHDWMWNQPKCNAYSNGVLNVKEKNYYLDLWLKLTVGANNVDTVLKQQSPVIDDAIKLVLDDRT